MNLDDLNALSNQDFSEAMHRCCGSREWVHRMGRSRPFPDREALFRSAEDHWIWLWEEHWREAFAHHPKIGDLESLRAKFANPAIENTKAWASGEQAGVQQASEETLQALADGNTAYEEKFGYIFIVCATGKTAEEMLNLLTRRLKNDAGTELQIAAAEQMIITRLRLEKLLT